MNSEMIIAIIKWGPLLFFLLTFLLGMLVGLVKGRRKTVRRAIYVLIFVSLSYFLAPTIANLLVKLEINGISVAGYINEFVSSNEMLNAVFNDVPQLEGVLFSYLNSSLSIIVFMLMVLVVLPLSFPIYWIYMIVYALISKFVFKYSKYKKDENGNFVLNEKGKKIKDKKDKHRLTAGFIKEFQYVALRSVILTNKGIITSIYKEAKKRYSKELVSIEYLEAYKDIFMYLDVFNDSIIGKITNSKINELVIGNISKIKNGDKSTTIENELENFVLAAIYIQDSGLIELLSKGVDIKTVDLTKLNIVALESAINTLFNSTIVDTIAAHGVNYVLENNLKDTLVDFSKDGEIVSKIQYQYSDEIKQDILKVVDILEMIINKQLLEEYQKNPDNTVNAIVSVDKTDVGEFLNKILSINIMSRAMPSIMNGLLKDLGLKETLTQEDNGEFVDLIVSAYALFETLELSAFENINEGNMLEKLISSLYKDGAIKENTKSQLASLLAKVNSSRIFDDILVTQLNKFLSNLGITLNGQMLVNIKDAQDWEKEILVLDDILDLYDYYKKNNKVDFLIANNLIKNLKDTKAMILAFPIAYQKLFPSIGIEVDQDKIKYIDYEKDGANEQEAKFYNYWKQQLVHLDRISVELAKLQITSLDQIGLDLLEIDANRASLAVVFQEVFTCDLLKDGVSNKLDEIFDTTLSQYDVSLNEGAITSVNNLVYKYPYYVLIDGKEQEIELLDGKYYFDSNEVNVSNGEVVINDNEYNLNNNSLKRIWKYELDNLSIIMEKAKQGDYTNKENLTEILNAIDDMYLLKDVKSDLLIYAVKQMNIIDINTIDKSKVDFTKEKEILLNVIDKYDVLKDVGDIEFATMDDAKISDLSCVLSNVISSDVFSNYVVNNMVVIFNTNSIKHDLDNPGENTKLIEAIKSINTQEKWVEELNLIKTLLNINTQEAVDVELFDDLEDSKLFGGSKANLLLRMLVEIDKLDTDMTLNTSLNVKNDLVPNEYKQYKIEKGVLLDLVKLTDIESIDNITKANTVIIGDLLDNMSKSVVFETQYDEIVNNMTTSMKNNADISSWGISVNTTPVITEDWCGELMALVTVRDNAASITEMNQSTADPEIIGEALDLLDASSIISDSESAASAIATQIMGTETQVTKGAHSSWIDVFEELLGIN